MSPEDNNDKDSVSNAYLDGLVFAREIFWLNGQNEWLKLLENRLKNRYGINLWELKSPVDGD